MRCVRQRVQLLFERIHPALLLNYDQLWKLSARGSTWKYWKEVTPEATPTASQPGPGKPRDGRGRFQKTDAADSDAPRRRLRQAPVHDPVSNARQPHTHTHTHTVHVDVVGRDTGPIAVSVEGGHNIARDHAEAQQPLRWPHAGRGYQKRHTLHEWGADCEVS